MKTTEIKAGMHQFTAKAPKPDKQASLVTKLCVTSTAPGVLASLFRQPSAVRDAVAATQKAKGKLELPGEGDEAIVRVRSADGEEVEQHEAKIDKVLWDFSGEIAAHEVHYTAPYGRPAALFALDNLGKEIAVTVTPAQRRLPNMEE